MKKAFAALCVTTAMILSAGCGGGLSSEETKTAEALASGWNGLDDSPARKAQNECLAEDWVGTLGLETLEKAGVINASFVPTSTLLPDTMTSERATAYGNAMAHCFDLEVNRESLKSAWNVDDKRMDAFIDCFGSVDRTLYAHAMRDMRIQGNSGSQTKAMDDFYAVVRECKTKAHIDQ